MATDGDEPQGRVEELWPGVSVMGRSPRVVFVFLICVWEGTGLDSLFVVLGAEVPASGPGSGASKASGVFREAPGSWGSGISLGSSEPGVEASAVVS